MDKWDFVLPAFVIVVVLPIAGGLYALNEYRLEPPETELLASGNIMKIEVFQGGWAVSTKTQITFENSSIILSMLPPEQNIEYGKCYHLYSHEKDNKRWFSFVECV